MFRKYLPIDRILKAITENSNSLNWLILNINRYPQFLYGSEYRKKKNRIGKEYDSEKKIIEIFNKTIETTDYYRNKYIPINSLKNFLNGVGFINKKIVLKDLNSFISDNMIF